MWIVFLLLMVLMYPLRHFFAHFHVLHLFLFHPCSILLPLPSGLFVLLDFPVVFPIISDKAYIILLQYVVAWQPLVCRILFGLNVHMMHPYFESRNILVCFYHLGYDAWCMFYDVPDCVKVDIECNIFIYSSPFVCCMP
jgi:hypothetical protein